MTTKVDRYAVMGNPVAHSISPALHQLFAEQTGQRLMYEKILVARDGFEQAVTDFRKQGGCGLNITLPFKQEAYVLAERLTERAQQASAVNTLYWGEDEVLCGDNTDGAGLIRDLEINHHYSLIDRTVFLLGAGGAARGTLGPLLACSPKRVYVINRTLTKAELLADYFSGPIDIIAESYPNIADIKPDLVINATSASLTAKIPPLPPTCITPNTACYDMVYAQAATAFLQWAKQLGAKNCWDGFGMLVEQAAESFYTWRTVRPKTLEIIQQGITKFLY